jgi:hypothetical protein
MNMPPEKHLVFNYGRLSKYAAIETINAYFIAGPITKIKYLFNLFSI